MKVTRLSEAGPEEMFKNATPLRYPNDPKWQEARRRVVERFRKKQRPLKGLRFDKSVWHEYQRIKRQALTQVR